MLDYIIDNTNNYIKKMPKSKRKEIGQFFTSSETAKFMANNSTYIDGIVRVLDAGAGTGILTASLVEKLILNKEIKEIEIDLYENNTEILELLEENMKYVVQNSNKPVKYNIINKNFIVDNQDIFNNTLVAEKREYDIVISNPPYKKIGKNDIEAQIMKDIVYGQPNLYFLFMAMAAKLLKEDGEMIFIVPRSWTSGAYFKVFRKYFLRMVRIQNIHLFVSRNKIFDSENVLQETIIIKAKKTKLEPKTLKITTSNGNKDFDNIETFEVRYNMCVGNDDNMFVYLPTTIEEIEVLEKINKQKYNLEQLGFKLKTGVTVDFRNIDFLKKEPEGKTVPLLSSFHFKNGKIDFPSNNDEVQYVTADKSSLLQKNSNYLLLKRFTTKEEKRRLQVAMFFEKNYKEYDYVSTENHINYICKTTQGEMDERELYGLYAIYNSTLYDKYYRILNGSTQVNANEINAMPMPSLETIKSMGKKLMELNDMSTGVCDEIIKEEIADG